MSVLCLRRTFDSVFLCHVPTIWIAHFFHYFKLYSSSNYEYFLKMNHHKTSTTAAVQPSSQQIRPNHKQSNIHFQLIVDLLRAPCWNCASLCASHSDALLLQSNRFHWELFFLMKCIRVCVTHAPHQPPN